MTEQAGPHFTLGAFCRTVKPAMSGVSRTKKGFMLDFFDAAMDKETVFVETSKYEKTRPPSKTSATAGAWAGVNQTDLVRYFNGERKLPAWKAQDFHNHLDMGKVEQLCDEIGIDALATFQQQLVMANINVHTAADVPAAIGQWLKEILCANCDDRNLLADGVAPQQSQLDLFTNLPLAEGRIRGGKLHLGSPSLPWKPPSKVPDVADPTVESGYTTEILAALEEHLGVRIADVADLHEKYQKAHARQRGHFWDAGGVRRNLRDLLPDGDFYYSMTRSTQHILAEANFPGAPAAVGRHVFDVEIEGYAKADEQGKGYCAFFNTVVALAFHAFMNRRSPHAPGFLLIDTPLHGFDEGTHSPDASMRAGLFDYFAQQAKDQQIIILENTDRTVGLEYSPDTTLIEFSKSKTQGRYGYLLDVYDVAEEEQ